MKRENPVLVEPSEDLKIEFLEMAADFKAFGDEYFNTASANFAAYLEKALNHARGLNLKPDRVQETEFWLIADGKLIGRSKLRHRLTPALEREGGHIGYAVRPSERRKGYGTLILKLTLEKAANLGFQKVLATCDTENTGSARIIEKNGGKFAARAILEKSGKQISRYWIEL
jgi:predicted acetyltransferase